MTGFDKSRPGGVIDPSEWFPASDGSFAEWMRRRNAVPEPEESESETSEWTSYFIGIDIGQRRDPSAVSVVELKEMKNGERYHYVRYLRRFPLRMLYTDVAARLKKLDSQLSGGGVELTYIVDATGVGGAVVEVLHQKLPLANFEEVYITGGINASRNGHEWHVPKGQLVSTLVAAFDADRVYLPKDSKEIEAMVSELENFEISFSESGHDQYGGSVPGSGGHFDLLISLALAVYVGEDLGGIQGLQLW